VIAGYRRAGGIGPQNLGRLAEQAPSLAGHRPRELVEQGRLPLSVPLNKVDENDLETTARLLKRGGGRPA
jgi:hypothetical protein